MPRARTGTLVFDSKLRSYKARVTVRHADGTTSRPWYCLDTTDEAQARRKMADLNRATARASGPSPTRFEPYALAWLAAREGRNVAQAESEKGWLKNHILPTLGQLFLADVRPAHVRSVLDAVVAKGLGRQTVVHIRATVGGILGQAWRDELIPENPVDKVKAPEVRETRKERVILTDEEIRKLYACEDVSLELRVLVVVARVEGGMRTRDLTAWTWSMLDLVDFAWCVVPRTKTGKPQKLEIPYVLRQPLRAWWMEAGRPQTGPVFPVTKGARKGEARKARGVSFADRLRRGLIAAGIDRYELHHETAWSLPVDFHSCRRAFATALAEAGVDGRVAMHLTGHADDKAHRRYVMETAPMRRIPAEAIPQLEAERRPAPAPIRPGIVPALFVSCDSFERETGFEPATLSLGSWGVSRKRREIQCFSQPSNGLDRCGSAMVPGNRPGIVRAANDVAPATIEALRADGRAVFVAALGWDAMEATVAELDEDVCVPGRK